MMEVVCVIVAFAIGAGCRIGDVPLPAPSRLGGALLVVAMSLGVITRQSVRACACARFDRLRCAETVLWLIQVNAGLERGWW